MVAGFELPGTGVVRTRFPSMEKPAYWGFWFLMGCKGTDPNERHERFQRLQPMRVGAASVAMRAGGQGFLPVRSAVTALPSQTLPYLASPDRASTAMPHHDGLTKTRRDRTSPDAP